jgi:predicted ArsR family transcriptional regulator
LKFDTSDKILLHIASTKEDQSLTQIAIARKLDVSVTHVGLILNALKATGIVDSEKRRAGDKGTKAACYYLTERGRQRTNLIRELKKTYAIQ